ncbi:hypothetical protein OS493_034631 [Desmophyllum pertusum]|uniref:MANSC domain-containing protein n=1 Tax=Desmophyllum pertusum TaxID=174260 RepID=A0A9X0D0N6_9CNID|nr:hypothetical protein OS493_034631 [Desmophyllum pertusum]
MSSVASLYDSSSVGASQTSSIVITEQLSNKQIKAQDAEDAYSFKSDYSLLKDETNHNKKRTYACTHTFVFNNATLRGGLRAGDIKNEGKVEGMEECVEMCCKTPECNVAMLVNETCYIVACFNKKSCEAVPNKQTRDHTKVAYVARSKGETELIKQLISHTETSKTDDSANKTKVGKLSENKDFPTAGVSIKQGSCIRSPILRNVRFKLGKHSGDFKSVGKVRNVDRCVASCCKERACNAIFMLGSRCHLVSCSNEQDCQTVEAKSEFYKPTVVYLARNKAEVAYFFKLIPKELLGKYEGNSTGSVNTTTDEDDLAIRRSNLERAEGNSSMGSSNSKTSSVDVTVASNTTLQAPNVFPTLQEPTTYNAIEWFECCSNINSNTRVIECLLFCAKRNGRHCKSYRDRNPETGIIKGLPVLEELSGTVSIVNVKVASKPTLTPSNLPRTLEELSASLSNVNDAATSNPTLTSSNVFSTLQELPTSFSSSQHVAATSTPKLESSSVSPNTQKLILFSSIKVTVTSNQTLTSSELSTSFSSQHITVTSTPKLQSVTTSLLSTLRSPLLTSNVTNIPWRSSAFTAMKEERGVKTNGLKNESTDLYTKHYLPQKNPFGHKTSLAKVITTPSPSMKSSVQAQLQMTVSNFSKSTGNFSQLSEFMARTNTSQVKLSVVQSEASTILSSTALTPKIPSSDDSFDHSSIHPSSSISIITHGNHSNDFKSIQNKTYVIESTERHLFDEHKRGDIALLRTTSVSHKSSGILPHSRNSSSVASHFKDAPSGTRKQQLTALNPTKTSFQSSLLSKSNNSVNASTVRTVLQLSDLSKVMAAANSTLYGPLFMQPSPTTRNSGKSPISRSLLRASPFVVRPQDISTSAVPSLTTGKVPFSLSSIRGKITSQTSRSRSLVLRPSPTRHTLGLLRTKSAYRPSSAEEINVKSITTLPKLATGRIGTSLASSSSQSVLTKTPRSSITLSTSSKVITGVNAGILIPTPSTNLAHETNSVKKLRIPLTAPHISYTPNSPTISRIEKLSSLSKGTTNANDAPSSNAERKILSSVARTLPSSGIWTPSLLAMSSRLSSRVAPKSIYSGKKTNISSSHQTGSSVIAKPRLVSASLPQNISPPRHFNMDTSALNNISVRELETILAPLHRTLNTTSLNIAAHPSKTDRHVSIETEQLVPSSSKLLRHSEPIKTLLEVDSSVTLPGMKHNQTSSSLHKAQDLIQSLQDYLSSLTSKREAIPRNGKRPYSEQQNVSNNSDEAHRVDRIVKELRSNFPDVPIIQALNHSVLSVLSNTSRNASDLITVKTAD